MDVFIFLGYLSTGLGILQNIPQIALIYRLKHADELSLTTMIMRLLATGFTSVYIKGIVDSAGFSIAIPIIISNVSSWITTLLLLYFKLYLFSEKKPERTAKVKPSALVVEF